MSSKAKQKAALGIIWKAFGFNKSEIARACDIDSAAVRGWFNRGRISAIGAIKLEKDHRLKGIITKEQMRPDVEEWFGI